MKKHICLVFLALFVLSEAFLKKYLQYSSSFQWVYPFVAPPAVLFFVASAVFLISCLRKNNLAGSLWDEFTSSFQSSRKEYWIFAGILLIGIFFRFWKLDSLFDGMTYDEAYKGLDGIAIRKFGERPIFLDWNGGREALVAYLVAISQTFFDYSILSVRIITPIMNCLLLVFFYLFAKTIFNSRIALLSTFLLAVSKWSIIHSRYGVRAGQFTVFEIAVLYFVARGIASQKKNSWSFVIAGIIGGLGFYTYIGYRVFPLILLSFLLQNNVFHKLKNHKIIIIAGCIAGLLIVAPVAKFYLKHRESMTDRMKKTLVWNQKGPEYAGINPVLLVLRSTKDTLGMFTYKGDTISRHNVEIEPMLSPFESAFFILGLIVVVLNWRKQYSLFLILFFVFALIPGILSVGAPNTPRVLAALPPTMLFVSFGILTALQFLKVAPAYIRTAVLTLFLVGNLYTGANDALIRHPEILDSLDVRTSALWGMDRDQTDVARLVNNLGTKCDVYLSPQYFYHSTIQYLTYSKSNPKLYYNTKLEDIMKKDRVTIVIFQPVVSNLWWLRDDEGKNFFKWWNQVYGIKNEEIHAQLLKSYGNDVRMSAYSDRPLMHWLRGRWRRYGAQKTIFDYYSIFIAVPKKEK
jgi:hypothetical protein